MENAEFFKTTFGAPNNAGIAAGVLPIAKLPNLMIFDVKQPDAEQQAACDHIKTAKNWKSAKMDFKCAE